MENYAKGFKEIEEFARENSLGLQIIVENFTEEGINHFIITNRPHKIEGLKEHALYELPNNFLKGSKWFYIVDFPYA
ncbi:hypothetical protein ACFLZJ_01075 [Nanoarchaeota archaeon]